MSKERRIGLRRTLESPAERRNLRNGLLFAFPWIVGFALFIIYPILASLYYSFCLYDGLSAPVWIGIGNYSALYQDELFWKSMGNTLFMVVFGLPINLVASLAMALLLNKKVGGIALYRTIYYIPCIVPAVAVSILWKWLFNAEYGLFNVLLGMVGIDTIGWLQDPAMAKPAFIIMGLWQTGGGVIILLAALQNVPQHLYEAADVDGAKTHHKFLHVTVPAISPVILFNLIMGIIGYFQYFTQAFVMTGGGPADSTLFYGLLLFNRAFLDFQMGYACAMAWILFLVTLICSLIVMVGSRRWVYYEGESK